ncbi:MAG: RimK family alpha-L-glutamate ligase [Alphaproteobacteria bacterium]
MKVLSHQYESMHHIAIISDIHDWHSQQLEINLKKKKCKVLKIKYEELSAFFNNNEEFLFNKKIKKINGVWARFINNGTLEKITTKLTFLHLLEQIGIYVHNSGQVIEKTVDKVRSTGLLSINKILSPVTYVSIGNLKKKVLRDSLLKPIFGSQGKNIKFINKDSNVQNLSALGDVFYLQNFLGDKSDKLFWDIRVLVSNHRAISAMKRISTNYVTNAYQGSKIEKIKLNNELRKLSNKVSRLFGLGYGGIDIKLFKKRYYILEVNSIPSWNSLQKVEELDISEILVNDFLKTLEKKCQKKS